MIMPLPLDAPSEFVGEGGGGVSKAGSLDICAASFTRMAESAVVQAIAGSTPDKL